VLLGPSALSDTQGSTLQCDLHDIDSGFGVTLDISMLYGNDTAKVLALSRMLCTEGSITLTSP